MRNKIASGEKGMDSFKRKINEKVERKLKQEHPGEADMWGGLRMFGMVGWSIVVPTLLGTILGIWLDKNHPTAFSWTLSLLFAGLFLGCFLAWYWIAGTHKEHKINRKKDED